MRFADGEVARRKLAMAGGLRESVGSELTPVLTRLVRRLLHHPAVLGELMFEALRNLEECLRK